MVIIGALSPAEDYSICLWLTYHVDFINVVSVIYHCFLESNTQKLVSQFLVVMNYYIS